MTSNIAKCCGITHITVAMLLDNAKYKKAMTALTAMPTMM